MPSKIFLRDILYVMLDIYETLRACQKGGYITQHLEEPAYKADVKETLEQEAVQRLTNLYWKFSTDVLKILMQLKSDVRARAEAGLPPCSRHSSPPWHGVECSCDAPGSWLRYALEASDRVLRPSSGPGLTVADSAALHTPQVSEVEEPEDILAEERQRLQARALQRQQSSMARSSMETYGAFQAFSAPAGAS